MVLMYSTILFKSKQAMVLSCKIIFQRASKQASKSIFSKTGLTKIPSFKQAYRSEVFRTCAVMLGHHLMHFRFSWSTNLVHASWHLKETVARTGVYRVRLLARLWWCRPRSFHHIYQKRGIESRLFYLGDVDPGPSTSTVEAQAPVFTRVQQARKASSG